MKNKIITMSLAAMYFEFANDLIFGGSEDEVVANLREADSDLSEETAREIVSYLKKEYGIQPNQSSRSLKITKSEEIPVLLLSNENSGKKHKKRYFVPRTIGKVNTSPKSGKYRK
ncbi:MAG: hypothetical protein J6A33_02235 [Alphaproteobacteria bacterium]|nr:hypothetical protein [Alphaproteobacteria bacterium]